MALTLTLTDGTTSLNFLSAPYGAQSLELGNPEDVRAEVMGLMRDGWDLVAHRYTKRLVRIELRISAASQLLLDTAIKDINEALRKARLWAMYDLGSRWRLQFNPSGSAASIYFVVKGGNLSIPADSLRATQALTDSTPIVLRAPLVLECDPLAEGTEETLANYFDNAGHEITGSWVTTNGTAAADTADYVEGLQSWAITLAAAAAQFTHYQTQTMTAGNHVAWFRYKITGDKSYEAYLSDAGGTTVAALTADGTWRTATVTRNSGINAAITAGVRTTGAVTDVNDVVKVDDCYLGDGTTAPTAWVSSRDVRNDNGGTQAQRNWLDVYPRTGDSPAKVQIKCTEREAHTKFWLGARHGTRMLNAGIWHEGEDFATWDSEPADGAASGGAYGRWASGIGWQDRDSGTAAATNTITVAHTPAGSNRLLLVGVTAYRADSGQADPTGITFGGVALTKLSGQANGTINVSLWYLIAPVAGAANVVATWAGGQDTIVLGAVTYSNAHQTSPLGAATTATGNSSAPSVAPATTSADLAFCVVGVNAGGAVTYTPGTGVTEHWDANGNPMACAGGEKIGAAGTTTMAWTVSSGPWAIIGVAIQPAYTAAVPKVFTKSVTTPPVGAYRVLARILGNGGDYGVAMGYAYGGVTQDPTVSTQYAAIAAATTVWHVLDIGSIIIPPATLPDGATIGTLTLRLCAYRTIGAVAYNLDVDWVMLLPVDFGSTYCAKTSAASIPVIDSISRQPTLALWDSADMFVSRPQQEGTPPDIDPDGSRCYLAADNGTDAAIGDGWTITVRIIPQYLMVP